MNNVDMTIVNYDQVLDSVQFMYNQRGDSIIRNFSMTVLENVIKKVNSKGIDSLKSYDINDITIIEKVIANGGLHWVRKEINKTIEL